MVAWTVGSAADMAARSVSAGGAVGDLLTFGPGAASSIIRIGHGFALAYDSSYRAYVRYLATNLILPVSESLDETFGASVALSPGGALIAAYDRTATEPVYGGVPRVFVKSVASTRGRPVRAH